ncbi:MAG: protein kinase [Prevotella sp.]|nr:protein kinase [Prevotella sp.]
MDINNMLAQGTMLRNGTYRIERPLSSGGFGNTYLVRNVAFNEVYAMKEFFMRGVNVRNGAAVTVSVPDNHSSYDSQKEKFKKEAIRLRALNNPHIVKVHDLFEENGTVYYVMDFINGESLADLMKRTGRPFSEQQTWKLLPQFLDALKTVHSQNIWHLDIKPGNIMIDNSGSAYLIDFGASKQISKSGSQTSSAMCYTPGYAPVEQVEQDMQKFGPWTDFYALGATLYYMQTLQQPPTSTAIAEGGAFYFPPNMSQSMQSMIRWMMEPSRNKRPASVEMIEQQLQLQPAPQPLAQPLAQPVEQPVGQGNQQPYDVNGQPVAPVPEDGDNAATQLSGQDDNSTKLPDGVEGNGSKKKGSGWWKYLLAVLLLAGIGVGAYFLFFHKSPEEKAAEADREEYEELVAECEDIIKDADNIQELLEAKKPLSDIEDMDDIHGRVMPDVYNHYDNLKKRYAKAADEKLEECIDEARNLMTRDEYKEAYDLVNSAVEVLPDNTELEEMRNNIAEQMGFLDVTDVQFANCQRDGTDINEVGSTLYASSMRYLFPKVIYNSLMPDGHELTAIELYYKIYNPDGSLNSSSNSPYGYTNKASISVVVGERNQGEWLNGWGNETTSTYSAGQYRFELYHKGRRLYQGYFQLH